MKPTRSILFATIGLQLALASTLQAATVLIDWSTAATQTSPDSNGNRWNTIGSGTTNISSAALNDVAGSTIPWKVSVTLDNSVVPTSVGFGGTGINGPIGASAPFNTTGSDRATVDGMFSSRITAIATITLTDLSPNSLYSFSAIGGRVSGGVNGLISVLAGTGSGGTLLNNGTVLDYSITSNASGTIAFTFREAGPAESTTPGDGATFNALRVNGAVPEPSAALLGAVGMLALLRRRRA